MRYKLLNQMRSSRSLPPERSRRGSTLVIMLALLGLLSFMGVVFYKFAAQERAASEYFSEAAKHAVDQPPNVFDHMLRHVIVGPTDSLADRASILRSYNRRHSMIGNLIGNDVQPHTGEGIRLTQPTGITGAARFRIWNNIPVVDQNQDGFPDVVEGGGNRLNDWLEFVDSFVAQTHNGWYERGWGDNQNRPLPPSPDVDYTYPDINNLFLAYRGYGIRDNGPGRTPRFEQIPVIIPSFFRPQYMKTEPSTAQVNNPPPNGPNGSWVPTDIDWASSFDGINRQTAKFPARSFRPSPLHIAGRDRNNVAVLRYVLAGEAAGLGLQGGFPFLPEYNAGNPSIRGELGVWTGSDPSVYELDVDNDGDGIREGIWLDLNYPIQEASDGTEYAILHSVTIYDLDSLINLNVHGNLAGLIRSGNLTNPGTGLVRDGLLSNQFVSRSNLGLGPNEINPLWALRTTFNGGHSARDQFLAHFGPGRFPSNDVEQANMEWIWLLGGRADIQGPDVENIFPGRWGESEMVYNTWKPGGTRLVSNLPRPGLPGSWAQTGTSGVRFGGGLNGIGTNGFDDNLDSTEGEADSSTGRRRPFGHPLDYAGTGTTTTAAWGNYQQGSNGGQWTATSGSPLQAIMHRDPSITEPERWLRYYGYTLSRAMDQSVPRYAFGQNGTFEQGAITTTDDLIADPVYDALFEDPLETIFDPEFARREFDRIFSVDDMLALHMDPADQPADLSQRLSELAPIALENTAGNTIREKFTTLSSSLRKFMIQPNPARAWEFTADSDGADRNGDGYPDGDGYAEFPPAFGEPPGTIQPYSKLDPFRPQVRRLLKSELGESRELSTQLPLSLNHLLDVERSAQTPDEGSQPVQFLRYMQRAGLRFRPLTEHPAATEGTAVTGVTSVPQYDPASPVVFPPVTPEQREYWARRDRQQLCRDIYVLLYTLGGAQQVDVNGNLITTSVPDATQIRNYLGPNDPDAAEGTALYTHEQLRQMAQFAVNLVDAMDTDDVITKFEYDKNFGDGWNLDDDASSVEGSQILEADANFAKITGNGRYREDNRERGVVYGVEAQSLVISEVLAVGTEVPTATMDHPATLYPDDVGRGHLFIELQNVQPNAVELAGDANNTLNNAVWRLVRHDRQNLNDPYGGTGNGGQPYRAFAFLDNAITQTVVPGGQRFTIATASDNSVVSSDLYVDYDLDNSFDLIAPNDNTGAALPTNGTNTTDPNAPELKPRCDLDLVHPDHAPAFQMVNQAGNVTTVAGSFLEDMKQYQGNQVLGDLLGDSFPDSGQLGFDLVLQRRANPNMPKLAHGNVPGQDPNPWVDVDVFRVRFRDLGIQDGDTQGQLRNNRLNNILSGERTEPLNAASRADFDGTPPPTDLRYNTIGLKNSRTPNSLSMWQPHFDRDFASAGELLQLPLCSPLELTSVIERLHRSPTDQAQPPGATAADPKYLTAAAAKFLQPDFRNSGLQPGREFARDNRWYRLFQFMEVPSRVHRMLGNYLTLDRLPGKLNLNTLRHWEVYAGLIDNPVIMDRDTDLNSGRTTLDRTPNENGNSVGRDRWHEFLLERDGEFVAGYDPRPGVQSAKAYLLPGTANARPFRAPGSTGVLSDRVNNDSDNGLEGTILRTFTADRLDTGGSSADTNRHWLEVGTSEQHRNPGSASLMHQHQVLTKIMNNTTTVSNVFVVYATAGYFEATEHKINGQGSGLYRIGSRIDLDVNDGNPTNPGWEQRAVFIIDRSEAFRAWDPGSGNVDWKKLVKSEVYLDN